MGGIQGRCARVYCTAGRFQQVLSGPMSFLPNLALLRGFSVPIDAHQKQSPCGASHQLLHCSVMHHSSLLWPADHKPAFNLKFMSNGECMRTASTSVLPHNIDTLDLRVCNAFLDMSMPSLQNAASVRKLSTEAEVQKLQLPHAACLSITCQVFSSLPVVQMCLWTPSVPHALVQPGGSTSYWSSQSMDIMEPAH